MPMHIDTHAFEAVLKNRLQLRMNTEWILTAWKADPIQHSNDTHELSWALCYISFEEPSLSYPIWPMFLSFLFHEYSDSVPIRQWNRVLTCTQCIIQESFFEEEKVLRQTLLQKVLWPKARHPAPRRSSAPFGTPLPTRHCVIRVTFTQWLNPFITRLTRWYLWKYSYPKYPE